MGLPIQTLPTGSITIDGTEVKLRGLSRSEAIHFNLGFGPDQGDSVENRMNAAERYVIEKGANSSVAEAKAFQEQSPTETVAELVEKILMLSGLMPDKPEEGKTPKASKK